MNISVSHTWWLMSNTSVVQSISLNKDLFAEFPPLLYKIKLIEVKGNWKILQSGMMLYYINPTWDVWVFSRASQNIAMFIGCDWKAKQNTKHYKVDAVQSVKKFFLPCELSLLTNHFRSVLHYLTPYIKYKIYDYYCKWRMWCIECRRHFERAS